MSNIASTIFNSIYPELDQHHNNNLSLQLIPQTPELKFKEYTFVRTVRFSMVLE